jgi:HK97 family phage prohead protease
MTIERKVLALTDAAVSDAGQLTGYGAAFGNRDDGGDVVEQGFFADVLGDFLREGFISWGHDWATPVAMPMEAREDPKGLYLSAAFHSDAQSQRYRTIAAERLAAGKTMGLSIGYEVAEAEDLPDARHLMKASRLFEVGMVMVPMNRQATISEVKSAVRPHQTDTSEAPWDSGAAEANLSNDAGAATYRQAYAWNDPEGDPDTKAAWKFIHHFVSADGNVGAASLTAAVTGIGVLNGGRGGTTIPDADRRGVWSHLAQHISDAGNEPPELKSLAAPGGTYAADVERILGDVRALEVRARDMAGSRVKEGRVLSASNRDRLRSVVDALSSVRQIQSELEALLRETEPPAKTAAWAWSARARLAAARAEFDIAFD